MLITLFMLLAVCHIVTLVRLKIVLLLGYLTWLDLMSIWEIRRDSPVPTSFRLFCRAARRRVHNGGTGYNRPTVRNCQQTEGALMLPTSARKLIKSSRNSMRGCTCMVRCSHCGFTPAAVWRSTDPYCDPYNRSHIRSIAQYSTKMIFAVLDVSLIIGLNIGETDTFFTLIINISSNICKEGIYCINIKECFANLCRLGFTAARNSFGLRLIIVPTLNDMEPRFQVVNAIC